MHVRAQNGCVSTKPDIRAADSDDLDELVALDQLVNSSPKRRDRLLRSVAQGECFIAEIDRKPIGYVILNHTFYENGFIALLHVAESRRRMGVGVALVQHAERMCRKPKLFTSTNVSNTAMQNLLQGQGYQPSGIITNLDDADDELLFFKRLSDGRIVEQNGDESGEQNRRELK
jgi:ribosomal protein S18 acetylase RimI-like enzyme